MPVILMFLKKYWLHIAVVAALVGAGWWIYNQIYDAGYNDANAAWEKKWSDQATKLAEDRAKAEQEQRAREQYWQQQVNEVQQNAEQKIIDLEVDLVAAGNAAVGLRDQAQRLAARASKTCGSSSTASSSQATNSTVLVLADVLARVEEAGRRMAEEAGRRGIAGSACQRAYESLKD